MGKTFFEWNADAGLSASTLSERKLTWIAAQAALLDHDVGELPTAIMVQPVREWPAWANKVEAYFIRDINGYHADIRRAFTIPRPAPKWEPEVGDVVFAVTAPTHEGFPFIVRFEENRRVRWSSGRIGSVDEIKAVKPFDPAKIGLPWSEI